METVNSLRKKGWKVRVLHQRKRKTPCCPFCNLKKQLPFKEKGGKTIVEVTNLNGTTVSRSAKCNKEDFYNKKIGVKIALGRCLKELEDIELLF